MLNSFHIPTIWNTLCVATMMLRHSRWSGRHIMPTGPGWMAVDQTGGVAACLVWNNNEKSSGGQAQHVNDQQSLEGCEQVSSVGDLRNQSHEAMGCQESGSVHCCCNSSHQRVERPIIIPTAVSSISINHADTKRLQSNLRSSSKVPPTTAFPLKATGYCRPQSAASEPQRTIESMVSTNVNGVAVAAQRQCDQRRDVTSAHQTASSCFGVSRSDTRLADDVISRMQHRSSQQVRQTAATDKPCVVESAALKQQHQSTIGVVTNDRTGTDKILDDVIKDAMLKNANRSLSFDCAVSFNDEDKEPPPSRSRQAVKHRQSSADKPPASLVTDKLTAQLATALADFKDVAVPYLEDDVIDALHRYLRFQSHHQQPTAETGAASKSSEPTRQSTLTKSNTTRPSTAFAVSQRPPPSTNGVHRQPLQLGRQMHRRRWLTTANLTDFRRQRLIEFRQGDVGPLSDLIVVRSATPQPSWKPSESQTPTEVQGKARQSRHIQTPAYRAGKTMTTHQAQNAPENDKPAERPPTSLRRTTSVDELPPQASCCSSCHQAHHADGGQRICLQFDKINSVHREPPSNSCISSDNLQSLQPTINKVQLAAAQSSSSLSDRRRHARHSTVHAEGTTANCSSANVDRKFRSPNNQQNVGGQGDSRKPGAVSGAAVLTLRFDTSFTT